MPESGLPPFPVDDATLAAVAHSLDAVVEFDADGNRDVVGADHTLAHLLDFLSGTTARDPNCRVLNPGDLSLPGIEGAEVVLDTRPRYSEHDLIRALVAEVFRLRSMEQDGPDDQENDR